MLDVSGIDSHLNNTNNSTRVPGEHKQVMVITQAAQGRRRLGAESHRTQVGEITCHSLLFQYM